MFFLGGFGSKLGGRGVGEWEKCANWVSDLARGSGKGKGSVFEG